MTLKTKADEAQVELVEKSVVESIQKSLDDAQVELQKARETIQAFEAAKEILSKESVESTTINSTRPEPDEIFVFGSNLEGRHGAGAAKFAKDNFGAEYGNPSGLQGQSYAIPTKDLKTNKGLPLSEIQNSIEEFLKFAEANPDKKFFFSAIGTGLAGHSPAEIASLISRKPSNVRFDPKIGDLIKPKSTESTVTKIDLFRGENSFLSNMFDSPVTVRGETYPTAEHAFQAAKFADKAKRDAIAAAKSPAEAKKLGRQSGMRSDWNEKRILVMEEILRAKFEQNPDLMQKLVATGDAELIEGNTWGDKFWGQVNGEGENNLGKILMKLREEFRNA